MSSGTGKTADDLPLGLRAYKRTPEFTEDTIPKGLRREHRTKPGVWALIHVLEGRLCYRRYVPAVEEVLMPGSPGIVRPGDPHEVDPVGRVRFYVEFHAASPDGDPPHAGGDILADTDGGTRL
ncbi:MAG: DUF1971 domain-containing protein [Sphingomonadales bacterium]